MENKIYIVCNTNGVLGAYKTAEAAYNGAAEMIQEDKEEGILPEEIYSYLKETLDKSFSQNNEKAFIVDDYMWCYAIIVQD